jgi:filamentous hemagglutinin family protein
MGTKVGSIGRRCVRGGLAVIGMATAGAAWPAGIVPDGASATTVAGLPGGRVTVGLAPPVANGVSHNTFSLFNVMPAGVDLQNGGVNARYIVAEVTSAAPSVIEGPLGVLGPRASFVLANPNGITVNGATLNNMGSVALTTGKVSFLDFSPAPGLSQRNIVVTTGQGRIEIGPGGLSGAVNNLELIAKNLRIDGPVENTVTAATARIRAIAGESRAEIDTAVSPVDGLTPWLAYTAPGTANAGAVLVDITPLGSLRAGRVEIAVTDRGAGVRHAGTVFASVGDFRLDASGELAVASGVITARRDVIIAAGSLVNDRGRVVASEGAVVVESEGDIVNRGALLQGAARIPGLPASAGAVTLRAGGSIRNESVDATSIGAIFGAADDVVLNAGGDVVNRSARIVSNRNVVLAASGDVSNAATSDDGQGAPFRYEYSYKETVFAFIKRRVSGSVTAYGSLAVPGQLAYLSAEGDVRVTARRFGNLAGEVIANAGDVDIRAAETVRNVAVGTGSLQVESRCVLWCSGTASSTVDLQGGLISASRSVRLAAGSEVENAGGRVFALADVTVDAPKAFARAGSAYRAYEFDRGLNRWIGRSWGELYRADQGGSFTANQGRLRITGQAFVEGGVFAGAGGVEADGGTVLVRAPARDPVQIEHHLGLIEIFR